MHLSTCRAGAYPALGGTIPRDTARVSTADSHLRLRSATVWLASWQLVTRLRVAQRADIRETRRKQGPMSFRSAGVEKRDDRADPTMVVVGLCQAEFGENAANVLFHGALGHPQPPANAGVRTALGHQLEHLEFARG
jgi:hypothetical protein